MTPEQIKAWNNKVDQTKYQTTEQDRLNQMLKIIRDKKVNKNY